MKTDRYYLLDVGDLNHPGQQKWADGKHIDADDVRMGRNEYLEANLVLVIKKNGNCQIIKNRYVIET